MVICPHTSFAVHSVVHRLVAEEPQQGRIEPATGYHVEVHVSCHDCDLPFEWVGPDIGVSGSKPTVDVAGTELRAPIRPKGTRHEF